MVVRIRALLVACACLMACALARADVTRPVVWVALGGAGGVYGEVATALRQRVETQWPGGIEWVQAPSAELAARTGEPAAVVAIGTQAWREMAHLFRERRATPVIATLVPASIYKAEVGPGLRSTAVWLDQPPSRQRRLVRELMPRARAASLLFGADSRSEARALSDALASGGFAVRRFEATADDFAQRMTDAFDGADVLLALPDPGVINARTLPNLLAASYRRLVPVIAYSPSVVRAGAAAAVYATPPDLGYASANAVLDILNGAALREAGPAPDFAVSINAAVARALELHADEAALLRALQKAEVGADKLDRDR